MPDGVIELDGVDETDAVPLMLDVPVSEAVLDADGVPEAD